MLWREERERRRDRTGKVEAVVNSLEKAGRKSRVEEEGLEARGETRFHWRAGGD